MPFLTKPKNLEGYVGDVGFDPFGFSDYFDMKWLREGELKNGRVAMLATVGFVVQQFVSLPMYIHVDDSNLAPAVVGASPMWQIVFFCGVVEYLTYNGNVTTETMFSDPDRVPGNLGFDPLGFSKGKSQEDMEKMQLSELKNGRLGMYCVLFVGIHLSYWFTHTNTRFFTTYCSNACYWRHDSPQLGHWRASSLRSDKREANTVRHCESVDES